MNHTTDLSKYKQYAKDVIEGKIIAGNYVLLACKRYLSFFDKYDFRPDKAEKVVNFIQSLKHFQGKSAGKPFILEDWQRFFVYGIFGFYHPNTDKRVCRTAILLISRKNGKSAFASAIMLYMMMADGERGAEIDCLANSRNQANIVFEFCKKFARSIDPKSKYIKQYREMLQFPKQDAKLQTLASDTSNLDGYSPYCAVLDEVHEYKDSKLVDVMESGMGFREDPLTLLCTTAGFNLNGYLFTQRQVWIDILNNNKQEDSTFPLLYELDKDDDWKDPAVWKKANPNLDITVTSDYIQQQVTKAINSPSLETGVKTKNLNIFCSSKDIWLPYEQISECSKDIPDDFYINKICTIGVDLAAVSDLTAVTLMYFDPETNKYYFKTRYYIPQTCLEDNVNAEYYKQWKREGYITVTPGNVTDYDYILTDMCKWRDKGVMISSVHYDQYNATSWAISCTEEGFNLQPFAQSLWHFNLCTKEFERLLKCGRIVLDNNPVTRWCFNNVTLKFDHNDNVKPIKSGNNDGKIDGTISILESLGGYLETPHYDNQI